MPIPAESLVRHAALSCAALLFAISPASAAATLEVTQVYAVGGELVYVGTLDEKANQRLFKLYGQLKDKPKTLSIQSTGGSVTVGIALGAWVREHKLDIKVMEYCLSSCANYVFPAGQRKLVSNFAVIGFHGGANSTYQRVAEASSKVLEAEPRTAEFKKVVAKMLNDVQRQARQEAAFLKNLDVQEHLVSLGQDDRYQALYKDNPKAAGWTYSAEGFAQMGVRDIVVINPPWSPKLLSAEEEFPVLPLP